MRRVPKLDLVAGGAPTAPAERFEVAFADEDGEQRLPLTEVWSVPFESCLPVRGFPSYKGQRNHVGRWWTATTGSLVGYESWLERDQLILLDFDPEVVGIASQPVATLESMLRLHKHDPGTLVGLVDYLSQRTGGMIGSLSQLVRGAAILAMGESEQLTRNLLDLVPVDYAATRATPQRRSRTTTSAGAASA